MSSQPIDYTALAKQAGAVASEPAKTDYAALAKQAGAVSSTPAPKSFGQELLDEAVINPAKQVASGFTAASATANRLTANTAHILDALHGVVSKASNLPKTGVFKAIEDWARENQHQQEETAQDLSGGRQDLASQIYRGTTQGVAEAPQYIIAGKVLGPTGGMAALGGLRESDKGWWEALKSAAEGAAMGQALEVMGPAKRWVRLAGAAAMTYAQARLQGADNTSALAQATTMGLMSAHGEPAQPGKSLAKPSEPLKEPAIVRPVRAAGRLAGSGVRKAGGAIADAIPPVPSSLNPVQQDAVDMLRANRVPVSAGTATGNRYLKSVEALTKNSPLGSAQAAEFARGTEQGLTRVAGELANQTHPEPATPESAGRAPSKEINARIADIDALEDEAYSTAWQGRDDPRHTYELPIRTRQEAVLDDEGKPTGRMSTVPVMAKVNMPVDVTGIKEDLKSVWDDMQWMPASDRASSAGYQAVKNILEGDDYIPAWQAERGLSGLKTMARVENPHLRNTSQGIAAGIIKDLQNGINDAVALTGDEAIRGLQRGRSLHANKMELGEIEKQLRDEPVQAFNQLTWAHDSGIDFLRKIADNAPQSLPKIGRAFVQQLIDKATAEGGFGRAQSIFAQWDNLGDQTKALLYPNADLRTALDRFFLGAKMVAENPNPSGTALVEAAKSVNPLRWAAGYVGGKILFTPEGINRLTRNLESLPRAGGTPPAGTPPPAPRGPEPGGQPPIPPQNPLAAAAAASQAARRDFVNRAKRGSEGNGTAGSGSTSGPEPVPAVPPANETPAPSRAPEPGAPAPSPTAEAAGTPPEPAMTTVLVPGSDKAYGAAYTVRELEDVAPSHMGATFSPNPRYGLRNDRDYSAPENQRKVVEWSTPAQFDPRYHVTDNPDATNGPAVTDADGNVIGGNGRVMILQRVYNSNPKGAQAYRDLLVQKAAQFGLDPAEIGRMRQPVLVREIPASEGLEAEAKQRAVTAFNKRGTAELKPSEKALADSRGVSEGTLDEIATRLEAKGQDATLADVLEGPPGTDILAKLIDDGVISPQESAAYAHNGVLTSDAKARIEKLMLGRFFDDPQMLDRTPASVRLKLERLAAPLAKVEGDAAWSLSGHLRDALSLLQEADAHDARNLDDFIKQRGLFGEQEYSREAIELAHKLRVATSLDLAKAARQYAEDARFAAQGPGLFQEPLTPRQAFESAFGSARAGGVYEKLQTTADDAMQRIRDRGTFSGTKLNAAVPVEDLADMAIWGAAKIAQGTITFGRWSKEMIADAGAQIKPHLARLYKEAQAIYARHVDATAQSLPKTKLLLTLYKRGEHGRDWYKSTHAELERMFGPDVEMMEKFLAATSPANTVAGNVVAALKAYRQWRSGQPFEGFLPVHKNGLVAAAAGQDFGGLKVRSFLANLKGDPEAVTVDRWVRRAFGFKKDTITDAQYKFMDYTLTQIAKRNGMEPRQLQAALWTAMKAADEGGSRSTSLPFEALLPKKIAEDPAMQALIRRGSESAQRKAAVGEKKAALPAIAESIDPEKIGVALKQLGFLKHVKVRPEKFNPLYGSKVASISASTKINSLGNPETIPGGNATGIAVGVIGGKWLKIWEVNSSPKGSGEKMVKAVLDAIPKGTDIKLTDWSNGFWDHMADKYPDFNWSNRQRE